MLPAPVVPFTAGLEATGPQGGASAKTMEAAQRAAKKAGEEFEALFISEMLAPVFKDLKTDGLFGGGSGEEIYRSMMVQEYGKAVAKAGGVGIAETVQREILKMQEMQS
ncbi:MAG TPA: hypothetical protein EYH07_07790 [Kiloniellaceae bacterium]|nr:hypothetical protein [Kiloniellaceae bacterium]